MDIILKQDIAGLGEEGDVKTVADGYARNFLIPKGMALHKTANNLRWLQRQETVIKNRKVEKQAKAKDLAGQLADQQVTVKVLEEIPGDWKMVQESLPHIKEAANLASWQVQVPAEGSVELTWRTQVRH